MPRGNNSSQTTTSRNAYSSVLSSSSSDEANEVDVEDHNNNTNNNNNNNSTNNHRHVVTERSLLQHQESSTITGSTDALLPSTSSGLSVRLAAAVARSYRPVAVADDDDDDDDDDQQQRQRRRQPSAATSFGVPSSPAISSSLELIPEPKISSNKTTTTTTTTTTTVLLDPLTAAVKEKENYIDITVLDSAQKKFQVSVHPDWKVSEFKRVGEGVHKVPPPSQRLIFRGKMLTDDKTLRDFGIVESNVIVHLFPKPKVVVSSATGATATGSSACHGQNQQQDGGEGDSSSGGAHIPHIVLDPQEAEQRSSILVLGSEEVMEAQNNVKLFSFMLLIYCSMNLLALFTLMLGDPDQQPQPTGSAALYYNSTRPPLPPPNHNHNYGYDDALNPSGSANSYPYDPSPNYQQQQQQYEVPTWKNSDYVNLLISALGFYVATLGIKATTENTLRLARQYLIGTVLVGIAWNAFYFFLNIQEEKKYVHNMEQQQQQQQQQQEQEFQMPTMGDYMTQAFFAILLPCAVWVLCCLRAWQFHSLLQEAEQEATERIRGELDLEQGGGSGGGGEGTASANSTTAGQRTTTTTTTSESELMTIQHRSAMFV